MKAMFIRMRALYIVGHLWPDCFRQYISPVNHRYMSSQWWGGRGQRGRGLTYRTFNRVKVK